MAASTRRGRGVVSVITPPGYGGAGTEAHEYPLTITWGRNWHPRTATGASVAGPCSSAGRRRPWGRRGLAPPGVGGRGGGGPRGGETPGRGGGRLPRRPGG